jgi:hypothetical protein|tara:strand:+ start:318 stop:938 length:621 start_codon:yes stop_codon:yes gene_type:complete
MTDTNAITRQPTQLDYASPAQFKFKITKLPKVEYFCTEVNIPGLQMSSATQNTPLRDIPHPGTQLDFGDLVLTYMVDEKFDNFEEIYNWLRGLGIPLDHKDYANLVASGRDRFPNQGKGIDLTRNKEQPATPQGSALSDATLSILSAKNNVIKEVRFIDMFPVSIGGVSFTQQASDIDYITSSVNFKYSYYEFSEPGRKASQVPTT